MGKSKVCLTNMEMKTKIATKALCKACKTKRYIDIEKGDGVDYGCIPIHKKGCESFKALMKYSVEV